MSGNSDRILRASVTDQFPSSTSKMFFNSPQGKSRAHPR